MPLEGVRYVLEFVRSFLLAQTSEAVPVPAAAPEAATQGAAAAAPGASGAFTSLLPIFILMFVVMYFFSMRPQQKRDKERRLMLAAIERGDVVVTSGGVFGTVSNLTENEVILEVDKNVTMKFLRSAIAYVTEKKS